MWLHLLLNKLLKVDEENYEEPAGDHLSFVRTYTVEQSENKDQQNNSVSSHFLKVPHVNQKHNWDCGLACVIMVLRFLGFHGCDIQELVDLCCTTSIWTVDLAYLLQKFSVSFTYCTVTLGANPDFSIATYYKEQLSNDLVRVNMLFQEAREAGICIECRSLNTKEISEFILSGNYVAIALVDQYKLRRFSQEDVNVSDIHSGNQGYTGHYIVICGFDTITNEFEIRDPANSRKGEKLTSRCLEHARKTFGTDEDLLLISLKN